MYTTTSPAAPRRVAPAPDQASVNPWLLWQVGGAAEPQVLSIAELAECRCPDLCDRDHVNE